MLPPPAHVKILLEYAGSNPGTVEVESVWAIEVSGGHKIDNIPFYAREVALGDIVATESDPDGMLRFKSLVKPSGHSTVRLWFAREGDVDSVRLALKGLGCSSEVSDLPRLLAIDVPPSAPRERVWAFLDDQESSGFFEYEEACLSFTVPEVPGR